MGKLKNLISKAWAKIKADLQRNLVATKIFILANMAISKAAKWLAYQMGRLKAWATNRVYQWQANGITLLDEKEKKRIEGLERSLQYHRSETAKIEAELSGK